MQEELLRNGLRIVVWKWYIRAERAVREAVLSFSLVKSLVC